MKYLKKNANNINPNYIVVSGDIAWSASEMDYLTAKVWFDKLLVIFGLSASSLIICPGNHDVDREMASVYAVPKTEKEADELLSSTKTVIYENFFEEYINFCENLGVKPLKVDERYNYLFGKLILDEVSFTILNSAWFYRKNKSDNLWIGLPHLRILDSIGELFIENKWNISVLHHPAEYLDYYENHTSLNRRSTYEYLSENSDLILSGHSHDIEVLKSDIKYNNAPLVICGATYGGGNYYNNFSLLKLSENGLIYRDVHSYNPRNGKWNYQKSFEDIIKRDSELTQKVTVSSNKNENYRLILSIEYQFKKLFCNIYDVNMLSDENLARVEKRALAKGVYVNESITEYVNWLNIVEIYDLVKQSKAKKDLTNTITKENVKKLFEIKKKFITNLELQLLDFEVVNRIANLTNAYSDLKKFNVPNLLLHYPMGRDFSNLIGRQREIKEILKCLKVNVPVSLIGEGGIGKTAIVQSLVDEFMYGQYRPFTNIYFMSFKNDYFREGSIYEVNQSIYDYDDLIKILSIEMNINADEQADIEDLVINALLDGKNLLILDNLETEIIQKRKNKQKHVLNDFVRLAKRFVDDPYSDARLLITSRKGLKDREQKYVVNKFHKSESLRLMKSKLNNNKNRLDGISDTEWKWVNQYTTGNPALLIHLSIALETANFDICDIMSKWSVINEPFIQKLRLSKNKFLNFCFLTTFQNLSDNIQLVIAAISYFSNAFNIYELTEELLSFLITEVCNMNLEEDIDQEDLINIGFLIFNESYGFYLNELIKDFLTSNSSNEVLDIRKLKKKKEFLQLTSFIEELKKK